MIRRQTVKKFWNCCAAAGMMLLSACASLSGNYSLTEKDSGRTLHLERGDTFTVSLEANPTTGYLWKFGNPPYDESVMILRGDKYIQPEEQLLGAPGRRNLTFVAEGSGRTGLRLIYVRPWEQNTAPAKEFHLMVIVKDGSEETVPRNSGMRRNSKGELVPDRQRNLLD